MIRDAYRYTRNIVLGKEFLNHTGNKYRFVGQSPYKGNPEKGLNAGATVSLEILEDNAPPIIDKNTGLVKDNNVYETFNATIVGVNYPLPFKKGDIVALDNFLEDSSFFMNFSLILRFGGIKLLKSAQTQGGTNATTGQTK